MSARSQALSYAEYQAQRYFEPLDGLRALSVLLVVSVHLGDNLVNETWMWLQGHGGVAVFFIISGYLITTLGLREEKTRGELSFKAFYVRRTLRIFPGYYYFIGITALVILSGGGAEAKSTFSAALPYYVTYMGEYAPSAHFYQSWSLGVEEKFYLLWPFTCFLLLKGRPLLRIAVAGFFAFVFPALPFVSIWNDWNSYPRIMFGCLIALVLHEEGLYERLRPWLAGWPAYAALAAGVALHFSSKHSPFETGWQLESAYTVAVGFVLAGLVAGRQPWSILLANRPMRFIGSRAYGIYLVHVACIWGVEAFVRPGSTSVVTQSLIFVLASALSLITADVLYRVVERPGIMIGRKLSDKILAKPAEATSFVGSAASLRDVPKPT